jgi:hypothetical protein
MSTQPNLEVVGGLPVGVTAPYNSIGALVSLKNYEALLELRKIKTEYSKLANNSRGRLSIFVKN